MFFQANQFFHLLVRFNVGLFLAVLCVLIKLKLMITSLCCCLFSFPVRLLSLRNSNRLVSFRCVLFYDLFAFHVFFLSFFHAFDAMFIVLVNVSMFVKQRFLLFRFSHLLQTQFFCTNSNAHINKQNAHKPKVVYPKNVSRIRTSQ